MKICILTHTFPRNPTDYAAPFMHGVALGMQEAGNEVYVLTPWTSGFKWNKKSISYKIITYKYIFPDSFHKLGYSQTLANDMSLKPIMWLLSPFMYLFGTLALIRLVRKYKIEIVNAHWILPNGFMAALVRLLTGVAVVSTLPGSDVYMAERNTVFSSMAEFATNYSNHVTSNSPQLLEDLAEINTKSKRKKAELTKKFSAIIYGVDPQKFRPDRSNTKVLKSELEIPKGDLVVLGVGRLVAKKGFKYLVEASRLILKKNNKVTFVVIGEGDERKDLETLARKLRVEEKFRFPGWADYAKLKHYYNVCDIFILPSVRDEEGNLDDQSVSVVEAMACAKPIVTTDFPGYKIIVKDGVNGYLVKEKNSKGIANSISKLVSSKGLREKFGRESRRLVISHFSWKAIGKQYAKLFEDII